MMEWISLSREEWGAEHGRGTQKTGARPLVVVHHTAQPDLMCGTALVDEIEAVQRIERFHAVDNGWAGIGYNFLITQNGHVFEGRGWDYIGAHAGSRADNARSYGICFVINGEERTPSRAALAAFRGLVAWGVEIGRIERGYEVVGHRDLKATACPGEAVYRCLREMRA
jgi:N-acetylmuramoyl-L-alanine amidase